MQGFTKAPASLVAASALDTLSVASQVLQDVRRAEKLQGPASLFLLTIADSGERKTTCDAFFTDAIRDYEKEHSEVAKPELARYAAELSAWEAEREGILACRAQRHEPYSICTLRNLLSILLARTLAYCPCCWRPAPQR